ncbi:MAG: hypothetical protein J1F35_05950 [Erysipelotrichales bacterium]|nr:hypothetical protein [Erysipelotrichales bacterium]
MSEQFILNQEEIVAVKDAIIEYIFKHQWFGNPETTNIQGNLEILDKLDKRIDEFLCENMD